MAFYYGIRLVFGFFFFSWCLWKHSHYLLCAKTHFNMNNEKTLLPGQFQLTCLSPTKRWYHLSMPNPFLSNTCTRNCQILLFFAPPSLWTDHVLLVYFTKFSAGLLLEGSRKHLHDGWEQNKWDGWVSLDEIRIILDCWPKQISSLMWLNHLVVKCPWQYLFL